MPVRVEGAMKLAASIAHVQGDPQRRAWVTEIRRRVPLASVTLDQKRNAWDTNKRAWHDALRVPAASHVIAMQDDMVPVKSFLDHVYDVLEARPESVVCYFSMRQALLDARDRGLAWLDTPDGCWGGTTILPRDIAVEFLAWERRNIRTDYKSADRRLAMFLLAHKERCYVTAPSLCQHEGDQASLMGHPTVVAGGRRRRSPWLATPWPINWNTDALRLPGTMSFSHEWEKGRITG